MSIASEIYQAQVARDMKHHAERVEWLSGPNPTYSDGVPLAKVDVMNWLSKSQFIITDPTGASHGYNTGPTEDENAAKEPAKQSAGVSV